MIYWSGLTEIIIHRADKESSNADALSCNRCGSVPIVGESEVQVACANKCTTACDVNNNILGLLRL